MIAAIAIGAMAGALAVNLYWQRKLIHSWRLTQRRERFLLAVIDGLGEKIIEGSQRDAADHYGNGMLRLMDELHNQERHRRDRWPRVPHVGDPWPDFEPAPLVFEHSFEGPS